ncbi:hypothetical protein NDU88_006121 [Pleurodeles waltl]|uniref:Uncharacterized protein n=1 Tax=Pleurodeles waltl TaxID=8319 RepID=A0AAV7RMZ0_PLEWA|nr:hypothetical protein NDU88_006121 [Pleurodeles waltl]
MVKKRRSQQEEKNEGPQRTLTRRTPKLLFGRANRSWNPEPWRPVAETRIAGPGEQASEPPCFRRSVAHPVEQWEETDEEAKDLLTYTKELRENLQSVWDKAHTNLREAQDKQKKGYDKPEVYFVLLTSGTRP